MALGFNSNLFNTNTQARGAETAGSLASVNTETAGTLASNVETAGTIAFVNSDNQIDSFQSSNPLLHKLIIVNLLTSKQLEALQTQVLKQQAL